MCKNVIKLSCLVLDEPFCVRFEFSHHGQTPKCFFSNDEGEARNFNIFTLRGRFRRLPTAVMQKERIKGFIGLTKGKILLKFRLLSTLLVLQKVVYDNKSPLSLLCLVMAFLSSGILA